MPLFSSDRSFFRVPDQTQMGSRRRTIAMIAMAMGGFGIGTTEFVAMGLLNLIAQDFSVNVDQAGHVISAYALGVVVGAPLITTLTGRIPRRKLALILMVAFTLGNALSVFAHSYEVLVISRFIAGLPHGAYFSVTALIAASLAPVGQRGRAVALVGLGLSVATVLGVPAAQFLGTHLGWNYAFALVTIIGLITLCALWVTVPYMSQMPATNPRTELGALVNIHVIMTLLIGSVGFGGMFAVYTYISWIMTERAHFSTDLMWIVLMAYGIGMVIGTLIGGVIADRSVEFSILFSLITIIIMLSSFIVTSQWPIPAIINFGLIGMSGSMLVPNLQTRLMDVAGDAQNLAAALNHSALNIANAGGAAVGGMVLSAGYGYASPAVAGVVMAVSGVGLWVLAFRLRRCALSKKNQGS